MIAAVCPSAHARRLRELRRVLVTIRAGFRRSDTMKTVTVRHRCGLCSLVDEACRGEDYGVELHEAFRLWPEFSGFTGYPVPTYGGPPFYRVKNKWSRHTRYGRARRRMLDWLIDVYLKDAK